MAIKKYLKMAGLVALVWGSQLQAARYGDTPSKADRLLPRELFYSTETRGVKTPEARPWCFWYWMYGCVSKQGVKADLQAMDEMGLEGADLFFIHGKTNPSFYEPALDQLSPAWWDMIRFTMQEAAARHLKLGWHLSDGFALAGGPWIRPENSMQQVVWSDTTVTGGQIIDIQLKQPLTREGYYRDIAVYAYPSFKTADQCVDPLPVSVTSEVKEGNLRFLADRLNQQVVGSDEPCQLTYEYQTPFLCRSITTRVNGTNIQCHRWKVEASLDGVHYWPVARLEAPRHGWQNTGADVTHAIPPTRARFFRFSWSKEDTPPGAEDLDNAKWKPALRMKGLYLSSEPKIHQYEGKNGSVWRLAPRTTVAQLPDSLCVASDRLLTLTSCLTKEGRLIWKAPAGNWTILRMGHTSTGLTNSTGGAARGLECDKLDSTAVRLQLANWFGLLYREIDSALLRQLVTTLHIDSWECGSQNWTATFPQQFKKKRGYDLMPFLPVMAGVPIGSVEQSEQVLYDVRRTIAELVDDVFFQTLVHEAHRLGCQVSAECVAPTMMSDAMLPFRTVDLPMGEFWLNSPTHDKMNDMLDAISGGHVYGKPVIQAEGFTELRLTWDETPAMVKPLLDRNLALGFNRLFAHVMVHNPFTDRKPGMTLDGIGLFFQRDQTWWPLARGFTDYIARCQTWLQGGHPGEDIAVLNGWELPARALTPDRLVPSLPGIVGEDRVVAEKQRWDSQDVPLIEQPVGVRFAANLFKAADWVDALRGYSYDTFNADAFFRATASNGQFGLPQSPEYRILIVPLPHPMNPDTLMYASVRDSLIRQLAYFKREGIPVLLPGFLSRELHSEALLPWKDSDFSRLGLSRDVAVYEDGQPVYGEMAWNHRRKGQVDRYFLANQTASWKKWKISLREAGRIPEWYDPVTDRQEECTHWEQHDGRTQVWVVLPPYGSVFVVLEKPTTLLAHFRPNLTDTLSEPAFKGPWVVEFNPSLGGPADPVSFDSLQSWSQSSDNRIRYYSGLADYTCHFQFKKKPEKDVSYWLELGSVADVAGVQLNGQSCGTAWTAPWRVCLDKALKQGDNRLVITVSNTWANRLEEDDKLAPADRLTWTNATYRKKSRDLLDAGLLGPVRLIRIRK